MAGKKFQFSLAQVLRLRQHETEQCRHALARAIQNRKKQEQQVAYARESLKHLMAGYGGIHSIALTDIRKQQALKEANLLQIEKEELLLIELQKEERKRRAQLVVRNSEEEALKTLKEQEKARFEEEERMIEHKLIEEQALNTFRRQQQSNEA